MISAWWMLPVLVLGLAVGWVLGIASVLFALIRSGEEDPLAELGISREDKMPHATDSLHCSSCGLDAPLERQGYTTCCGEPTCGGDKRLLWADPSGEVVACCFARAYTAYVTKYRMSPGPAFKVIGGIP